MSTADDLLAQIDPWTALADGRRQLLAAIEATHTDGPDLALLLEIAGARDEALREVALAYAQGARDFADVRAPDDRLAHLDPPEAAQRAEDARGALMEAAAAMSSVLDEELQTPWGGCDTWRMHLVTLAMHDAAAASALLATHEQDSAED